MDTLTVYTGNTPQTGDAFARLGVPVNGTVSADIAEIEVDVDGISAASATALLASIIESGFTLKQALRIITAAVAGKSSGGPDDFIARSLDDSRDCVIGTTDSNGNRITAVYNA